MSRPHPPAALHAALARPAARLALWLALIACAAVLASACDLFSTDDEDDQAQQAQAAAPAPRQLAQPIDYSREADEVYNLVSPSIALVLTRTGPATGLVTDSGMIYVGLTQLGGALAANVRLSDGTYLEGVPLAGANPLADSAMLGPIDRRVAQQLPGSPLGDGERLAVGAPVYALGFAKSATIEPVFDEGLVSKRVHWSAADLTLIGASVTVPDDQAGLVLVDATGQVIGLASTALAANGTFISAVDLAPRPRTAGAQAVVPGPSALIVAADLGAGQIRTWETQSAVDQPIRLTIEGTDLGEIAVEHVDGTLLLLQPLGGGRQEVLVPLSEPGRLRVLVTAGFDAPASFQIRSSTPLLVDTRLGDQQPASIPLVPGQSQVGFALPGSASSPYQLLVGRGAQYAVRAESISCDMELKVSGVEALVINDAIGGAGRGDAIALIRSLDNSEATIEVGCADGGWGAFILTAEQSELTAETVIAVGPGLSRDLPPMPPWPTLAMRGSGVLAPDGVSFAPDEATLGFSTPEGDLAFDDGDGAFEVLAYIIGSSGTSARVRVFDNSGALIREVEVATECVDANPCRGSSNFLLPRGQPGRYLVDLQASAGEPTAWQIEVHKGR